MITGKKIRFLFKYNSGYNNNALLCDFHFCGNQILAAFFLGLSTVAFMLVAGHLRRLRMRVQGADIRITERQTEDQKRQKQRRGDQENAFPPGNHTGYRERSGFAAVNIFIGNNLRAGQGF